MPYEIKRFPHDGAVDADGHIMEPPNLWETYLEDKYKSRAIRVVKNDKGHEILEVDGKPISSSEAVSIADMGLMGNENIDLGMSAEKSYEANLPYGACNPQERIDLLNRENVEKAILYPTLSLLWERDVKDAEITLAYQRAYNRWLADFCKDSNGQLIPIAHLSLLDANAAADELERAVNDGCKGGWVAPFTHSKIPHGSTEHDALFAKACELDVPLMVHPTWVPGSDTGIVFDWQEGSAAHSYAHTIYDRCCMQQIFASFVGLGTFDRFPNLTLGILEASCGWIGMLLDRLDAVALTVRRARGGSHELLPSEYFRRQCFISGDPEETAAPYIIDHVGADNFVWATDYPHPDHVGSWQDGLEKFIAKLSPETSKKVLGENISRIFKLNEC